MRFFRRFLCSLLLLSLSSCGLGNSARYNDAEFPVTDDTDLVYLKRNGDNFDKNNISYSYADLTREATHDSLSKRIDGGESVFLFLHSDGCPSCQASHDDLARFFLTSGILVEGLHFTDETREAKLNVLYSITAAYPNLAKVLHSPYVTPSIYIIRNGESAVPVSFLDQRESLQNLEEFLKNLMNFTYVYTFRTFDSYLSFAKENECLVYRHGAGDAFFYDTIYPLAKHSKLHTAELQVEYFSEADKKRCEEYFGEADLGLVKGNTLSSQISVTKSPDQAGQLIRSYYKA